MTRESIEAWFNDIRQRTIPVEVLNAPQGALIYEAVINTSARHNSLATSVRLGAPVIFDVQRLNRAQC